MPSKLLQLEMERGSYGWLSAVVAVNLAAATWSEQAMASLINL